MMAIKYVIQCAAKKSAQGGSLRDVDGTKMKFVALPELYMPLRAAARPDDISTGGSSWREKLIDYNNSGLNSGGLFPAYQLYARDEYRQLVQKFGIENVYILSAGWGLIKSDFLTPNYDITFSNAANVPSYAKRKKTDKYRDFSQLECGENDTIVFIGGKDYQRLFDRLTASKKGRRVIFYNSETAPQLSKIEAIRYTTNTKTNWHYELAKSLIDGITII